MNSRYKTTKAQRKAARKWYYANAAKARRAARKQYHIKETELKKNPKKLAKDRKHKRDRSKVWRARNRTSISKNNKLRYAQNRAFYVARATEWAKANPERRKEIGRTWQRAARFRKLGFSIDSFYKLLQAQNKKCAVCLQKFSKRNGPNVDHCHTSGKVRGLLCRECNLGLGNLHDSVVALRRAISYLTEAQ